MKRTLILLFIIGVLAAEEGNLTLKECVGIAFKNSIELKIADENLKQAELNKIINYAPFYPSVNLSLGDTLLGFDDNGLDIPLFAVNPDTYSASLNVSYNVYNMYKDYDQYRYAGKKYEEAELSVSLKKQELSYNVISAYFDVLSSEKNLEIREKTLSQKKEYLKLAESLFKAGIKPKSDYLNALVQIKKSEISLKDAEAGLKISKAGLNTLLGTAPDKELNLEVDSNYGAPEAAYGALLEKMFKGNLDWKKINIQSEYISILTSLSERTLLPEISVDASYSLYLDKYAGSSAGWTHFGRLDQNSTWGISASLSYPIFDGYTNISKFKASKSSLVIANMNIENLKRELTRSIYVSFLEVNRIYEELEQYKVQVGLAKESLELIKNRYQSGISSFLDLIDAELNYTAAEIGYYQAVYDYKLKGYDIEKLCGVKLFWQ